MSYGSGSTGYTSAARVKAVIDEFFNRPTDNQTSAVFANLWSSRAVHHLDVPLSYVIGGGENNSAAGWMKYIARLYLSTANTSTKSVGGILHLPDDTWRTFTADLTALNALSTTIFPDGTTDADHGRRVYQFLVSTVISGEYINGQGREILEAWGAANSSAAPSS